VRTLIQEFAQVDSVLSADGRRPVRRRKYTTPAHPSLVLMKGLRSAQNDKALRRFPNKTGLCYSSSALPEHQLRPRFESLTVI